jgi:hypothetical protein
MLLSFHSGRPRPARLRVPPTRKQRWGLPHAPSVAHPDGPVNSNILIIKDLHVFVT